MNLDFFPVDWILEFLHWWILKETLIAYDSMARSVDPKLFWAPSIPEFEDLATQTSKNVSKINDCIDDFW